MSISEIFKQVELRKVKKGDLFKRKPSAKSYFVRNHYNREHWFFGAANFCCTNWDTGNEIFLKPSTIVFVEV